MYSPREVCAKPQWHDPGSCPSLCQKPNVKERGSAPRNAWAPAEQRNHERHDRENFQVRRLRRRYDKAYDKVRRELRHPLLDRALSGVEGPKGRLARLTVVREKPAVVGQHAVEPTLDIRYHLGGRTPAVGCVYALADERVRALSGDEVPTSARAYSMASC